MVDGFVLSCIIVAVFIAALAVFAIVLHPDISSKTAVNSGGHIIYVPRTGATTSDDDEHSSFSDGGDHVSSFHASFSGGGK